MTAAADLRVLTVRQPWASLIALGVKRLEVRSWATRYRGLVAVHAGQHRCKISGPPVGDYLVRNYDGTGTRLLPRGGRWPDDAVQPPLPFGAVVAVARLIDCVPIVDDEDEYAAWAAPNAFGDVIGYYNAPSRLGNGGTYLTEIDAPGQAAYAPEEMWTPGHWAWVLDDVVPLPTPHSYRGGQGLRRAAPDLVDACAAAGVLS